MIMKTRKTFLRIGMLLLAIPIFILSCEKMEDKKPAAPQTNLSNDAEKMMILQAEGVVHEKSTTATLVYLDQLCNESDIYGDVGYRTIGNSALWDYYQFYGTAGQPINIYLVRVDCEMDAAYTLFFGTSTTTDGINRYGGTNPDLVFLAFRDDNLDPPSYCEESCFAYWDPNTSHTLPYTGWYTLGVYDYIGCNNVNPLDYHLTIAGLAGCGTIAIDGCETYVDNQYIDGEYMQWYIDQCAIDPKNHGQYVRCVAQTCEGWVELGLITQLDQDAIVACAAESGIPYPE